MTLNLNLTLPLTIGNWYRTREGKIVQFVCDDGDDTFPLRASDGESRTREGQVWTYQLGAQDIVADAEAPAPTVPTAGALPPLLVTLRTDQATLMAILSDYAAPVQLVSVG